jgi:hypothetical protein
MRCISTRAHGILDIAFGMTAMAAPWFLGFADQRRARNIVVAVEATTIVYGLLSDHELALSRKLPMPLHLKLDVAAGALMASSPWLLGFAQRVWLPHVAIGLGAIGAGLLTETEPRD